jgi:hypothetical protein
MSTKRKKSYEKPRIEARRVQLGVYGNYGRDTNNQPQPPGDGPISIFPHEA